VVRTLESVIVDDASSQSQFSDDAYLLLKRPRSILCLPLVQQRELIGVLYLENNLTPGVFTRKRLAVLELLASQAAISLKNAQLYDELRQENRERKKAEEELRHSTDALNHLQEEVRQASRVAMMGELTAALAHELNQPLGGILSNAQAAVRLLAARRPDLAEVKAAVAEIISDNSRAVEVIRNVRALFQRDEAQMSPVDLKQILLDAGRMLAADATARNVILRFNLPDSLPTLIGNRTQLLQALINLVLNAFDAVCENGTEMREVEIRASQPESGQVHIAVSDSGNGIDPEIMPRLFDAFFTTKPKGTGMGLAIVRSIIENHGGRLWAIRNPEHGSTLEFYLPVKGGPER
jgi:C4-dicarboxylate-specific signal transduction histidine kinase